MVIFKDNIKKCTLCTILSSKLIKFIVFFIHKLFFHLIQVLGHKEGLNVMEQADPLFLLIGLPTIPLMLVLGKMVRWEDYVLRLWRKHSSKLPLLNYLFPDGKSFTVL